MHTLKVERLIIVLFSVYNVNSSVPELDSNAFVMVHFDEELFNSTNIIIKFSSNCTSTFRVDYSPQVRIPIPDSNFPANVCQYSIQLFNEVYQKIGYPITGFYGHQAGKMDCIRKI